MKPRVVEVMFSDRCPQLRDVIERVRRATAESPEVEIHLVLVDTLVEAEQRGFLGSPTVRVDGRDVEPNVIGTLIGLHGRGYVIDGRVEQMPLREWIRQAL